MSGLYNQNRNFIITPRLVLIGCTLVLLSLACNLPLMASQSTGDQEKPAGFVETSIAETMAVIGQGQPVEAEDHTVQPDPPTATFTPESTDTPTLTPTATETPTPEVVMIYSSANTHCRIGQGTFFQWLVTMQQGESSEAVGIDTSGDYWYIRRPDQPNDFCWLWGKYATPSGPYDSLPVYTPMPTPTPGFDFKLTFYNVTHCVGNSYVQFQIDNNGSFTLESWESTGTDNSGGIANLAVQEDKFFYHDNCPTTQLQNDLEPGEGSYLNVTFLADPTGHNLTVKIKVCAENGMAGECLKKTLDIKP